MSAKLKRLASVILVSLPVLTMGIVCAWVFLYDYESWVDYLLKIADKQDWRSYFKEQILSMHRFNLLKVLLACLTCLSFFFSILLFKKRLLLLNLFYKDTCLIIKGLKKIYLDLSLKEKVGLLLVFLFFIVRAIYIINSTELQYDEAWTFVHFSSKGFLVSALSPNNNHQLYTIFSSLLWKMNVDAKYAVRLPALLFSTLALLVLFIFIHRIYGKKIAIISVIILSVSIPFYFFSVLGRGYAPMLFFMILASFSILSIASHNSANAFMLRTFSISSILGIYASPSFIYIWILNAIVLVLLNHEDKKILLNFFKAKLAVLFFTMILLMPMIISGGVGILGSAADTNVEIGNFLMYLHRLSDWLFLGLKWNIFFILLGLAILIFVISKRIFELKKNKNIFILQLYWLWPFIIFVLSGVESPYRIWFWMPFFICINMVIIINCLIYNKNLKTSIFTLFLLLNFYTSQNHYFMNWSVGLDKESKKIAQVILDNTTDEIECYTFSRYDKPLLDYYFLINNRSAKNYMPFKESKNYMAFENRIFDAVLLDTEDYKASDKELEILQNDYKVIYQNSRIKLFKNKIN